MSLFLSFISYYLIFMWYKKKANSCFSLETNKTETENTVMLAKVKYSAGNLRQRKKKLT